MYGDKELNSSQNAELAIETNGLVKKYGEDVLAVDGINLSIPTNSIYALLGPNGAGKTTTIAMLTTLFEPTSGTAKVANFDVVNQAMKVRRRIGVTFQEMVLDLDLTGRQVLDYHGRLYGMKKKERQEKIAEFLALVELEKAADRLVRTYSGGMKRRLELVRALMNTPSILFLDEPTLGLDPQTRNLIWQYIQKLKQEKGMTLLLTTHYMDEAEQLADKVAIIDHGKIVVEGTPQALIEKMGADVIRINGKGEKDQFINQIKALPYVQVVNLGEDEIQIGVDNGNRRLVELISLANKVKFDIEEVSITKPNLDEVFFQHTGRSLRAE
ncbi:MAG: ATP-binding cassette domain-containing protein [Candidatus Heimdallarchaeota archaeon]